MKKIFILIIKAYQVTTSPFLGYRCRFYPTCSSYAQTAIERHGIVHGAWLILKRVLKCHPLYKGKDFDPVPEINQQTN